jgi:hypothetical protein
MVQTELSEDTFLCDRITFAKKSPLEQTNCCCLLRRRCLFFSTLINSI